MDAALVKPRPARRTVWLAQEHPAQNLKAHDVFARGSTLEVHSPRALRPLEFCVDYIYQASLEPPHFQDVCSVDLPPLLQGVLAGTDACWLVGGCDGGGQNILFLGPYLTGQGSVGGTAAARLVAELQERQNKHRQSGSSGYSFQVTMQYCQIVGERIDDLLSKDERVCRVLDTEDGVVVENLRSVPITTIGDAESAIMYAEQRKIEPNLARATSVIILNVSQADYFARWGLFGRLMIIVLPALDVLIEDLGVVQVREGFDTYRGLFHLKSLATMWDPKNLCDVAATTLTFLLHDALLGGNVNLVILVCLQQGNPIVSAASLEFLESFAKVMTNPICYDHKIAGYTKALRTERLLKKADNSPTVRNPEDEYRRIILELERKILIAERSLSQNGGFRSEDRPDVRRAVFQERVASSQEEYVKACQSLVEMQLENVRLKDEMSDARHNASGLHLAFQQELAEERQRHKSDTDILRHESETELAKEAGTLSSDLRESRAESESLRKMLGVKEELNSQLTSDSKHLHTQLEEAVRSRAEIMSQMSELKQLIDSTKEGRAKESDILHHLAEIAEQLRSTRDDVSKANAGRDAAQAELLVAKEELLKLQDEFAGAKEQLAKFPANGRAANITERIDERRLASKESGVGNASDRTKSELLERNRDLQRQVDRLTSQLPSDQRATMHRLQLFEKTNSNLEAERAELLVRTTVAEGQLEHMQLLLKELTDKYQTEITSLKRRILEVEMSHAGRSSKPT